MKYLLDTHTLLWWWSDDPRLSLAAREAIGNEDNLVLVSAASAWEIATKHRIGKLPGAEGLLVRFHDLVLADGFEHLPMSHLHALRAGTSAAAHRDPFDRMLAAQAQLEGAVLVSADAALRAFPVTLLW